MEIAVDWGADLSPWFRTSELSPVAHPEGVSEPSCFGFLIALRVFIWLPHCSKSLRTLVFWPLGNCICLAALTENSGWCSQVKLWSGLVISIVLLSSCFIVSCVGKFLWRCHFSWSISISCSIKIPQSMFSFIPLICWLLLAMTCFPWLLLILHILPTPLPPFSLLYFLITDSASRSHHLVLLAFFQAWPHIWVC